MKIAMVSEHASPLAVLGGEDAGGQNVHVAALASALADRDLARAQGEVGRRHALERFGLARFLADWDRLLEEVAR